MSEWTQPKTDWTAGDFFNNEDFNRIKNNLNYLHEKSQLIWGEYEIIDMGEDSTEYDSAWSPNSFNAFENNLDTINEHMLNQNYGIKQTFYYNGLFIGSTELNRLESAILSLKRVIDGWYEGMETLPYRLGARGTQK